MILKLCAGCSKRVVYPATYCDRCQEKRDELRRTDKAKADQRYNKRRDPGHAAFYHAKEWKIVRAKRLQLAGYKCEYCKDKIAEDVHHTIPIDTPAGWNNRLNIDDLRAVCVTCHNREHGRF